MNEIKILFFGSTTDSVIVLEKLFNFRPKSDIRILISGIVTQPPRPVGRKQVLTPTPVETWAKEHRIPVLSFPNSPDRPYLFADEQTVIDTLSPTMSHLIISASFGQKIPTATLKSAKFGGLNVHPSLLPHWRGADPVPWAILSGDRQTGVTIVTLEEKFDAGKIMGQKKIPILKTDFSDPLRTKLFSLGAELLVRVLPDYLSGKTAGSPQHPTSDIRHPISGIYARRLTRDDGFIPWDLIKKASEGFDVPLSDRPPILSFDICHLTFAIERAWRALSPWPGIWTEIEISDKPASPVGRQKVTSRKRLKIISLHLSLVTSHLSPLLILDSVQLEGKKPVPFVTFRNAYPLYPSTGSG